MFFCNTAAHIFRPFRSNFNTSTTTEIPESRKKCPKHLRLRRFVSGSVHKTLPAPITHFFAPCVQAVQLSGPPAQELAHSATNNHEHSDAPFERIRTLAEFFDTMIRCNQWRIVWGRRPTQANTQLHTPRIPASQLPRNTDHTRIQCVQLPHSPPRFMTR
jgi:hypothetical protein